MQVQVSAAVFRPPRWNFAQVCIWCGVRFCRSAECEVRHEQSWWAVCEDCGGDLDVIDCICTLGVVEVLGREKAERRARRFQREYVQALRDGPVVRLREAA